MACNEIGIDISVIKHIDHKLKSDSSPTVPIHEAGAVGSALYHRVKGFEIGFQKALEILGDKKYNYGHLDKMFTCGKLYQDSKNETYCFDNVLSKFEQTEWDVEIEMECVIGCQNLILNGENSVCCGDKKPKLDANGCLILKRK
jgi:hypothetical protein